MVIVRRVVCRYRVCNGFVVEKYGEGFACWGRWVVRRYVIPRGLESAFVGWTRWLGRRYGKVKIE